METRRRQEALRALPAFERGGWLRSLRAFDSRLHWHCHFIQKLESEPEIEFECFIRALNDMRDRTGNPEYLAAWSKGMTGYPFVDACMRSLRATGWINFRMRAMLVSFAAYDLFLTLKKHGSRNRPSRARRYSVQTKLKSEVNQLELFSSQIEE